MNRAIQFAVRRRRLTAVVLALAAAGVLTVTVAASSMRADKVRVLAVATATDSCGYSGTVSTFNASTPRTSYIFNESTVLKGFAPANGGTLGDKFKLYYSDEHALTAGGPGTTPYDGSRHLVIPPGVLGAGNDPLGRPFAPTLYITDLTVHPNRESNGAYAGDWQNNNDNGPKPNDIFGTWKASGAADPTANKTSVGSETWPSGFSGLEAYDSVVVFNTTGLNLIGGHLYRFQSMVHDGDQNKAGGDVGEACTTIRVPKPQTEVKTDPKIKIQENVNVSVKVDTSTGVGVGASLKADGSEHIHVTLFKGTCSAATAATGGTRMADTLDIPITASNYDSATGKITANLTYPDDFPNATALSNGGYWWFVSFDETPDLLGSDDACTEQFSLNVAGLS